MYKCNWTWFDRYGKEGIMVISSVHIEHNIVGVWLTINICYIFPSCFFTTRTSTVFICVRDRVWGINQSLIVFEMNQVQKISCTHSYQLFLRWWKFLRHAGSFPGQLFTSCALPKCTATKERSVVINSLGSHGKFMGCGQIILPTDLTIKNRIDRLKYTYTKLNKIK